MFNLASILGGSLGDVFSKIVGAFKLSPEKAAELEMLKIQNAGELAKIQSDLEGHIQDAISNEVQQSAEIIKTEAGSQSWLPRNVRPMLLLLWGSLITFNYLIPLIAKIFKVDLPPVQLDPWVYKLTAIGYTGYVGFRTWEKVKDADQ